jgi:hypothetical protein
VDYNFRRVKGREVETVGFLVSRIESQVLEVRRVPFTAFARHF